MVGVGQAGRGRGSEVEGARAGASTELPRGVGLYEGVERPVDCLPSDFAVRSLCGTLRPMSPESKIDEMVQTFVSKVTALAREAAIATLTAHLDAGAGPSPRPTTTRTLQATGIATARRPHKGAKRPAEDIARLERVLTTHISKNPGQRVEQINNVLGTTTRDVRRPLAKLLEAGTVKTRGTRRATQYFLA